MRVMILQEILSSEDHILGYLYRPLDLDFIPTTDLALQMEDGYTCLPVHVVYDVPSSSVYVIDTIQALFLGNCEFRDFLDEHRDAGWRFKEDIYPNPETMRIEI